MADRPPPRRPALPFAPVERADGRLRIAPLPEGLAVEVAARPGSAPSPAALQALAGGAPHAVRRLGPGRWLVIADAREPADPLALAGTADVFDLSHARVRLLVEGPGAEALLATGVGVDLSPGAFPVGAGAPMLFRRHAVHLCRTGPERFELVVARSFARDLWEDLTD